MNKIYIIKKFLLIMFFYIFFINYAYSEIINKFNITGNNRVTDETILMFSNFLFQLEQWQFYSCYFLLL